MSEFFDVEYEIEQRFIKGLKSVFEKDNIFRYNRNYKDTMLQITTDYPDIGSNLPDGSSDHIPEMVPHIIVTGATYQLNTQMSFGYNFLDNRNQGNIKDAIGDYAFIYPFNVNIICVSDKSTSKDIASRVAWYLSFAASHFFSEKLGLQINGIQKGNASPSSQYPNKIFDTVISVSGTIYWVGSKKAEGDLLGINKPLKNINIKF